MHLRGSISLFLFAMAVTVGGCATRQTPAHDSSTDPKNGAPAGSTPGVVSCDAKLKNNSNQTLTLTGMSANPSSGWNTGIQPGTRVAPGDSIGASIQTVGTCSATLTFSSSSGGGFKATFSNPWDSASSWSCKDNSAPIKCTADGNSHGQPLNVNFTTSNP